MSSRSKNTGRCTANPGAAPVATPLSGDPSFPDNNRLEILAGNDQRAILGDVEFVEQSVKLGLERLARLGIDRFERLDDRTVVAPEHLDPVAGRSVPEDKLPALSSDGRLRAEQGFEMYPAAPECGRFDPRRWRNELADGLEQPADKPLRRPVGEADLPARTADAD